jgi:hypothetical protein
LPWTIHLILIGQCKQTQEREFYMRVAIREQWGKRELERQINACLFERAVLSPPKVAAALRQSHPEHLAKMEFYLEALDRDVRKSHERPSIGVLLCATKDNEVVEYALSRAMSPALIAEYQTRLPDKKLLQRKLHEFYQLALPAAEVPKAKRRKHRKA